MVLEEVPSCSLAHLLSHCLQSGQFLALMTVPRTKRTKISLIDIQLIINIHLKGWSQSTDRQSIQVQQQWLCLIAYSNYQFQQQKAMTIRHRANITQKINDFEVVLSKYSAKQNENQQISELIPNSKRSQNMGTPLQSAKGPRNVNYKEDSIKTIDEKINIILKKHQHPSEFQRPPLGPRNNIPILIHKKQSSLYELEGKEAPGKPSPFSSSKKQPSQKTNEAIKEQCKRLRQRSNKIFEQNTDLTDRYQSQQQPQEVSKYDKEIKKLNERIKKTQEQKKKLNIQFSPFVASAKSKSRLDCFSKSSGKPSYTATPVKVEDKFWEVKLKGKEAISEFNVEGIASTTPLKVEKKCGIVKNRIIPQQSNKVIVPSVVQNVEKVSEPIVPVKKIKSKQQINEFISVLCKQIALDQQLRNQKIWFTFSNEENKWQLLEDKLNEKGANLSTNLVRSIFQSTVQQHNPFYRWGNVNFCEGLNSLTASYEACNSHWQSLLSKKWNKQRFEEQSLKQLLLFQHRKEQITLQDLVRFLNTETGHYYRNRDLVLIFKRLTPGPHIGYSEFISLLTP